MGAAREGGGTLHLHAALLEAHERAITVVSDLEAELGAVGESTGKFPDDEHDAEGSTVAYERARVGALLAAARSSVQRLDYALARYDSGDYETCESCGSAIGEERAASMPEATRCVLCARQAAMPAASPAASPIASPRLVPDRAPVESPPPGSLRDHPLRGAR